MNDHSDGIAPKLYENMYLKADRNITDNMVGSTYTDIIAPHPQIQTDIASLFLSKSST